MENSLQSLGNVDFSMIIISDCLYFLRIHLHSLLIMPFSDP